MSKLGLVEVKCQGASSVPLNQLEPFQGELKTLSDENYQRLKKDILELGFSEPISIWAGQEKAYILNGHQRLHTLKKMREEGYEVPADIPVNTVEADSIEQAKRKVLSLTSQFGEMSPQGLFDFVKDTDIKFDDLESNFRFPEMDMVKFKDDFFAVEENKGSDEGSFSTHTGDGSSGSSNSEQLEEIDDEDEALEAVEPIPIQPGAEGLGLYWECEKCGHIQEVKPGEEEQSAPESKEQEDAK